MIKIIDEDILLSMRDRLYECLGESLLTGELIDITGLRQIGKTTALINFARSYRLPIIVHSAEIAKIHRNNSGYREIYSCCPRDLSGVKFKRVIVDEGVDIAELKRMGFDILAGYHSLYY